MEMNVEPRYPVFFGPCFDPVAASPLPVSSRVNAGQERLERFVREIPLAPTEVERGLRASVPCTVQGAGDALIVDGMGIK